MIPLSNDDIKRLNSPRYSAIERGTLLHQLIDEYLGQIDPDLFPFCTYSKIKGVPGQVWDPRDPIFQEVVEDLRTYLNGRIENQNDIDAINKATEGDTL